MGQKRVLLPAWDGRTRSLVHALTLCPPALLTKTPALACFPSLCVSNEAVARLSSFIKHDMKMHASTRSRDTFACTHIHTRTTHTHAHTRAVSLRVLSTYTQTSHWNRFHLDHTCRDRLGFTRNSIIPKAGRLKGCGEEPIDAIQFYYDLSTYDHTQHDVQDDMKKRETSGALSLYAKKAGLVALVAAGVASLACLLSSSKK